MQKAIELLKAYATQKPYYKNRILSKTETIDLLVRIHGFTFAKAQKALENV